MEREHTDEQITAARAILPEDCIVEPAPPDWVEVHRVAICGPDGCWIVERDKLAAWCEAYAAGYDHGFEDGMVGERRRER
jgi:hypothetical protein